MVDTLIKKKKKKNKTVLITVHKEKEILKVQQEDGLSRDFNEKGAVGLMTMKMMTSGSDRLNLVISRMTTEAACAWVRFYFQSCTVTTS
jgi:hypothetical protein